MKLLFSFILCCITTLTFAQDFTRTDSIFGSITPEREWWDLQHYELNVEVFPDRREIKGTNTITYAVINQRNVLQLDLQPPMKIDKVMQDGERLKVNSDGMFHYITLNNKQQKGKTYTIEVTFSGKPRIAKRPPWDGGFSWEKDTNNKHFIATSNQGIGASVWWPNKDHPYDEPDFGIDLTISAPADLIAVGNGRLVDSTDNKDTKSWHWKVVNPINNYGVNINIGDYSHFSEKYVGLAGELDMDYWVLRENEEKAKLQFKQAPMMMEAFEYWFGPYPFYEDSFKLVEVPYLGMEHQSSVTYGNRYKNGYLGMDLSGSGWGLKFDFIIIHEAGHEWFANNITNRDVADMWIHEGFTAYSENLYLDYHFGKEASSEYVVGTRRRILNDKPIIGRYDVRDEGSTDKYYKGANVLHTLRQLLEDDDKWRNILTGLNKEFGHRTVKSKDVENYISMASGIDLTAFWEQYLRTTKIPKIRCEILDKTLRFRYENIVSNFDMPLIALINEKEVWLYPKADWTEYTSGKSIDSLSIKKDFYVEFDVIQDDD